MQMQREVKQSEQNAHNQQKFPTNYNQSYNNQKQNYSYNQDSNQNKYQNNYNNDQYKQQQYNNYDGSALGENLNDIDYSQVELKQFQKQFYIQGTPIYTDEQIKAFQKEKSIIIRSKSQNIPQPFIKWSETQFPPNIMSLIKSNNYAEPMPIQSQCFPVILSGNDLIGIAQTGSGKTLAFLLPSLIHINAQDPVKSGEGPIVLILAPTRELAIQINEQFQKFGSSSNISSACIYGGVPRQYQERELQGGCDVIIATPGRLIDFLETGTTDLRRVTYLVLDEADRMLDMGFEPQIRKIIGQIRPDRQTLMFSATWPRQVRILALDFCQMNPIHIQIGDMENNVNDDIEQIIEIVPRASKFERLCQIIEDMGKYDKAIIFAQTKIQCDELKDGMIQNKFRCLAIHGDKSQRERDKVMDLFKQGKVNILIATDVASRGLDVKDIKLVINFDFPKQIEDYIHRVGRTGRAGALGKAISFLDVVDDKKISKELVDILKQNNQFISSELLELSDQNNVNQSLCYYGLKFSKNNNQNNNKIGYMRNSLQQTVQDNSSFNFRNQANNEGNNNVNMKQPNNSCTNIVNNNNQRPNFQNSSTQNQIFRQNLPQEQEKKQNIPSNQPVNQNQSEQNQPKRIGFFNAKKEQGQQIQK